MTISQHKIHTLRLDFETEMFYLVDAGGFSPVQLEWNRKLHKARF